MYNRYIGNTGKFYRVEEPEVEKLPITATPTPLAVDTEAVPPPNPTPNPPPRPSPSILKNLSSTLISKNGLGGIAGGLKSFSGGLKDTLKGILPDGIDIGDLLLILVLILLYLENEDEESLIILGALLFLGFD